MLTSLFLRPPIDRQAPALGLGENVPAVACWIDTRSGSSDPFSARIQRTRGATFETWRNLRWGTNDLANLAITGPAADPDGDGIPNFSEYALGLEPNHADSKVFNYFIPVWLKVGRSKRALLIPAS